MRAVYRTSFSISGPGEPKALPEAVARTCWDWVAEKIGQPELRGRGTSAFEVIRSGDGQFIESMRVDHDDRVAWGLRYVHRDRSDDALQWCTELTLLKQGERLHFACTLSVGRTDNSLVPFRRFPSRPSVVASIVRGFVCRGAFRLSYGPLRLHGGEGEVERFAELIKNPKRRHPILYISTDPTSRYLINPITVANYLAGVAYVVCAGSPQVSDRLKEIFGERLTAYNGSVRLYWPQFPTTVHPLWTPYRIIQMQQGDDSGFGKRVLGVISSVAVTNVPEDFLTWEKLQEMARWRAIEEARNAKDDSELLVLYTQENETLQARLQNLQNELAEKSQQLYQARQQIEAYRAVFEDRATTPTSDGMAETIVGSVAEAMEYAEEHLSDRLVFSLNSKSEGTGSPFQPAGEVLSAFRWLATVYYNARSGKDRCADFDKNVREFIPGWKYSAHQKTITMRGKEEWYRCPWSSAPGGKLWIPEHLKCGRSRRPEETIRIAFTWESESQKVVIGFIGQHQENTAK